MLHVSPGSGCFVCSFFLSQETLRYAFMVAQRPTEPSREGKDAGKQ